MRNLKPQIFVIVFLFSVLSFYQANGQEADGSTTVIGIGASFFNITDYTFENFNQPTQNIYLTMDVSDKIRIEPSLGFVILDGENSYTIGIGLFGKKAIS